MSVDAAERFSQAADLFGSVVHQIRDDQWANPTPCTDWDVRALVNHVIGEQLWAVPLLDGKTIAEVGDRFDGDQLGTDPVAAWDVASAESKAAFANPGALDRTVHLSYGDESAINYCGQMTLDAVVHSWDLARGIGAPDSLPADLTEYLYGLVTPMKDLLAASGMFAAPVAVDPGANTQIRLLALLGRDS